MTFWHQDINTQAGPHKVLLKKGEWIDEARGGRVVPYKAYYPDLEAGTKVPLIIWSHGFGGNRDGAAFISRYVASFGYVIVHLTHDGTDSSLWEGKPGHPWDILRKTKVPREITIERFRDVPFALDCLERSDMAAMIDFDAVGMSGHSFGAMTTQVMAGQLFPDANGALSRMKEARFKAGIVYSPVPIAHLSDASPEELYEPIDIPLLHMTGTEDASPIEGFGYEHRLVVAEHTGHPDSYVLVKQGGDHMVYNGTRGKLAANPLRDRHEEIVQLVSLAFWDAYLKGDQAAMNWLKSGAQGWLGEDARF